jgi:hypothetical protein
MAAKIQFWRARPVAASAPAAPLRVGVGYMLRNSPFSHVAPK